MKFDAMDKFNLREEKKEKWTIIMLFSTLFLIILFFIFIIYLYSLKIEQINFSVFGLSQDHKDEFNKVLKNKRLLQIILPNFKTKLKEIYFIDSVNISYIPINKIKIILREKKPLFIAYDRNRGFFYEISDQYIVLRQTSGTTILLQSYIVSLELQKIYKKGEKIDYNNYKIDLYNEDYQLSEIIVDKGNFFGIPVNYRYIISFGSFVNKIKTDNLNLLFWFLNNSKEDERFNRIRYIDMSYSDMARIILE